MLITFSENLKYLQLFILKLQQNIKIRLRSYIYLKSIHCCKTTKTIVSQYLCSIDSVSTENLQ